MADRTISKTTRIAQDYEAFANETLSISTTAVPLTVSIHDPANGAGLAQNAFITIEDFAIRYWIDGTLPTITLGHIARPGETFELTNYRNILNFKAINAIDSETSIIMVTYGR